MSKSVTLTDKASGKTYEMPVMSGSVGPDVIDVRKLYTDTGYFTYDPGYTSTGACKSKITYIDGDQGILLHRGYAIEDLAEHSDFMEVAYLILKGELPNAGEKTKFARDITLH
ncbi:MAG: citrate/2-methylcitrate synthase, partial [Tagaea sp.]